MTTKKDKSSKNKKNKDAKSNSTINFNNSKTNSLLSKWKHSAKPSFSMKGPKPEESRMCARASISTTNSRLRKWKEKPTMPSIMFIPTKIKADFIFIFGLLWSIFLSHQFMIYKQHKCRTLSSPFGFKTIACSEEEIALELSLKGMARVQGTSPHSLFSLCFQRFSSQGLDWPLFGDFLCLHFDFYSKTFHYAWTGLDFLICSRLNWRLAH